MKKLMAALLISSFVPISLAADVDERQSFIINNIIHVLYHEAGHAVIDQFELPVIGQEEDASDSFATVEVLDLYEDPYFILLDSAEANFLMQQDVNLNDEANYFDSHDLDIQRAYRIVCTAVGFDPVKYGEIADWAELPEYRQESCEDDAYMAASSWSSLREMFQKPEGEKPAEIKLSFADEGDFSEEKTMLVESGVMDDFRNYLATEFQWPAPVKLSVEQCDEPNAFYDPAQVAIIMCYEMVRFFGHLEARR